MLISVSALSFGGLSLSGCALTTAGVKKGDERNFARSLNDVNAARAIKARMRRAEGFDLGGVDVEVAEGIVLLSGNVPTQKDRIEVGLSPVESGQTARAMEVLAIATADDGHRFEFELPATAVEFSVKQLQGCVPGRRTRPGAEVIRSPGLHRGAGRRPFRHRGTCCV